MNLALGLAEQFELEVKVAGRISLPAAVTAALSLEPGDAFAITKNDLSLRLDSERELGADWAEGSLPERWWREFLCRRRTVVEADGSLAIPSDLLSLPEGVRLVLEVVTRGLSHEVYLYRVDG